MARKIEVVSYRPKWEKCLLKQKLAIEFTFAVDGYCGGKDTFVKNMER
ncbi:hypothetical protein [Faecalimonas sp.]